MFLYLIQVQVVLCTIISATSYYWFCGFTPFEIVCGSYGQQCNSYSHESIGGIDVAVYKEACGKNSFINEEKGYLLPTLARNNNFADVSTECSSHHQGKSEGGANKTLLFIATHY